MDAVHIEASILQLVYTVFIKPPLHHLHSLFPANKNSRITHWQSWLAERKTSLNLVTLMAGKAATSCPHLNRTMGIERANTLDCPHPECDNAFQSTAGLY